MLFELNLIKQGFVTIDQMLDAVSCQRATRVPLGRLAVRERIMTMADVFRVLEKQADVSKPFGRLAIEMGLLTQNELDRLLILQTAQEQPLSEVLVAKGYLARETLDRQMRDLRRELTQRSDDLPLDPDSRSARQTANDCCLQRA